MNKGAHLDEDDGFDADTAAGAAESDLDDPESDAAGEDDAVPANVSKPKTMREAVHLAQAARSQLAEIDRRLGKGHIGKLSIEEIDALHEEQVAHELALRAALRAQVQFSKEQLRTVVRRLPIQQYKSQFIQASTMHRVMLVTGRTGCGKSTQVPQFLLQAAGARRGRRRPRILVCQSRRVSATALASRVALEQGAELGQEVGFVIGGCNATSRRTRICFATVGVLLQMLTGGNTLSDYSHVILDEVHERTLECDLVLACLRSLMVERNKHLRLVLMSATMESFIEKLGAYFQGVECDRSPCVLDCGGEAQVDTLFLEQMDHLVEGVTPEMRLKVLKPPESAALTRARLAYAVRLVHSLHTRNTFRGAILVFLPGLGDILDMHTQLERVFGADNGKDVSIVCMHSSVSVEDQHRVFKKSDGPRMIVLSTNIAESALTIRDLGAVVDFCLHKVNELDRHTQTCGLKLRWITKPMCAQRAGRCGRTTKGVCYRLVTSEEYEGFSDMAEPESQVLPLHEVCLKVINMDWCRHPRELINNMLDPPLYERDVDMALAMLAELGCIQENPDGGASGERSCAYRITFFGKIVSRLPVGLHGACLIATARLVDKEVFDMAVPVAAALCQSRSVIAAPWRQQVVDGLLGLTYAGPNISDDIQVLIAYRMWLAALQRYHKVSGAQLQMWCAKRGISAAAMRELHDRVLCIRAAAARMNLCDEPMSAAERQRALEQRKHRVSALSASDVDEHCGGAEESGTDCEIVCSAQLLSLSLNAGDDCVDSVAATALTPTPAARGTPDPVAASAEIVEWVRSGDAACEIAAVTPSEQALFALSCVLFTTFLHQSFSVCAAPKGGAKAVWTQGIQGEVSKSFLQLQLSHAVYQREGTGEEHEKASKVARESLERQLSTLISSPEGTVRDIVLPVAQATMWLSDRRIELLMDAEAGVGQVDDAADGEQAPSFTQTGMHWYTPVRLASKLVGRSLKLLPPLVPEVTVSETVRGADGKLALPRAGHRSLAASAGSQTQIVRARLQSHVSAQCRMHFAAEGRAAARVQATSVCHPLVLVPHDMGMHFGAATMLVAPERHEGAAAAFLMQRGTVLCGCPGAPELITLALDQSVTALLQRRPLRNGTRVTFLPRRLGQERTLQIWADSDVMRAAGELREAVALRIRRLHEAFVAERRARWERRQKAKKAPGLPFDEERIPKNALGNPLAQFCGAPRAPARRSGVKTGRGQPGEESEDDGVIPFEATEGDQGGIDGNCAVWSAIAVLRKACSARSEAIRVTQSKSFVADPQLNASNPPAGTKRAASLQPDHAKRRRLSPSAGPSAGGPHGDAGRAKRRFAKAGGATPVEICTAPAAARAPPPTEPSGTSAPAPSLPGAGARQGAAGPAVPKGDDKPFEWVV
eukprot:TRINITY_DN35359_c0_g1_i1.p1 TRINITY_DN35359_c0_g1~~TRINITY_DN35359_c0_g1_i1.p1  ORF type:complete len:1396 (+),score=259.97 TRINITY_DN35359_c0_g1_i1:166-4353(+)